MKKSWWSTLPGVLTALAGVITAITGLLLALNKIGVFSDSTKLPDNTSITSPRNNKENQNRRETDTSTKHCQQPSVPILAYPGDNQLQPNHYYGKGKP